MSKAYPKVYILVLNYNGWSDTIECLESVFRNSYPNYQVVVIDNASSNGSMEKIKGWANGEQEVLCPDSSHPLYHLSHPFIKKPIPYVYYTREEAENGGNPELEEELLGDLEDKKPNTHSLLRSQIGTSTRCPLTLIQTGDNLGFAGGNNVGIRYALAKGDCGYVWLLNNDTVIDESALTEMMSLAENDQKIAMVGSKLLYYDKPAIIQEIGGGTINYKALGIHIGGYFEEDKGQWDKPIEPDYITAASVLVRKHLIDRIGLLDEAYFMYIEDLDWSLRAKSEGYKLIYSYKSMIWHKKGSSTGTSGNCGNFLGRKSSRPSVKKFSTTYYYNIRNRVYFVKKYFLPQRLACFFIYFPFKILRLVSGIYLYNDDHKSLRIKLIFKAVYDGLIGKMGKTV